MKKLTALLILLLFVFNVSAQEKVLLIRADDMGMSHSVNAAFEELFKTGLLYQHQLCSDVHGTLKQ
jgi:hypothetical protein